MKTVWILCILMNTNGWFHTKVHGLVKAYETEIECNKAMKEYRAEAKKKGDEIWHEQCESTDAMLQETKTNQQ
jgi:uncharacterized membrane protein